MLVFTLSLFCLVGLSLLTFLAPAPIRVPGRAKYARPPADWPDIPVDTLGLFRASGRINQPGARPLPPIRLTSFDAAQDHVLGLVNPSATEPFRIALRLSADGPDWTDVLLNDICVAQVATSGLIARQGQMEAYTTSSGKPQSQ
ncbi:MAG: hypothetical protein ACEPO2_05130 [Pelagibaca sp.]